MVALAGPGWRLAPSLVLYVEEVDRRFPGRDRSSDGSIGDQAHASRESDHNPYDGYVHAVDLDEDVAPGIDLDALWSHLIARRDPRVRYVIYEGAIVKSYVDSAGHVAWKPYLYSGANAHSHHLHLSISRTTTARTDERSWGIARAFPRVQPAPPPKEDDDVQQLIVKGDKSGKWYITNGIHGRYIDDRAEAAALVYAGLAKWYDGEPFVVPQDMVDDLAKVS